MNSKVKGNVEEWTHMKAGGGSGIIEKNKNRRGVEKSRERTVEYLIISYKVIATFIIIYGMCKRESV